MVTVTATTPYAPYRDYRSTTVPQRQATASSATPDPNVPTDVITISDEAKSALVDIDYPALVKNTDAKLAALLTEAGRNSPLKNGLLAVDLSSLTHRELYAMASDESFTTDEKTAAGLEMERRFNAALAGPAAIARVTGNYTGLYKAAAAYLDGLGPEEKKSADWKEGREAITKGLEKLKLTPGTLPQTSSADPVQIYLKLNGTEEKSTTPIAELSGNARTAIDQLYANARANGKVPSFNPQTKIGTYIDLAQFSSRMLSAIVLDTQQAFSSEEVFAAKTVLSKRSAATLSASFSSATSSGDPTAFSRNIITAYTSLSADERLAVGWSDRLYQAAMDNYLSTSKLLNTLKQTAGTTASGRPTVLSFLGR